MPDSGALTIAQALKAAQFDAAAIANALLSAEVYPALTAEATARLLLDTTMFPTLTRQQMTVALTAAPFPDSAIAAAEAAVYPPDPTAVAWNFTNITSQGDVSSCGATSAPPWASAVLSQTGGGPTETFTVNGRVFPVFLTRFLGTQYPFVTLTLTQAATLQSISFSHYHNHNPGYPSYPSYQVQIQADTGSGFVDVGQPINVDQSSNTSLSTIALNGFAVPAGTCRLRWFPKNLAGASVDTNTEYFAIADLALTLVPRVMLAASRKRTRLAAVRAR